MKWSISFFIRIYRILSISSYFIFSIHAHIGMVPSNAHFYTIYSLDHNNSNLLYHLESGTVHKQNPNGLKSIYRHAHLTSDKIPTHATTLGYITKHGNNAAHQQFVYVEPNKTK